MSQQIDNEMYTKLLHTLLEETFDKVEGIYLDGGTSMFETLDNISAEAASRPITPDGTTIASQVGHVEFYLGVMESYMRGGWSERIDWQGSWKPKTVTEDEWAALRKKLRETHDRVIKLITSFDDWNDERKLGGALGVIVHTAYHLGAIRQIVRVVK